MQRVDKRKYGSRRVWKTASSISAILLAVMAGGCGGHAPSSSQATTPTTPQRYLAPIVEGSNNGGSPLSSTQTYTIDDVGDAFTQTTYGLSSQQEGAQIINAGTFTTSSRGLLSLEVTANYFYNTGWTALTETGGFALQLAGQAGGLVQLPGQPVDPLVPTAQCPTINAPQPYLFVSIPGALIQAGASPPPYTWNPVTDTAFGTVDISTSGSSVSFKNITQYTLSGAKSNRDPVTGACGQTAYGNTISIPGQITVTNPGSGGSNPPQAIAGIGPTGLLVEDNGVIGSGANAGTYMNALGAGTGAVGLPKPSSDITSAVAGAQYLGFIYGAGVWTCSSCATGWSSHLASFGFPAGTAPANCSSLVPPTVTNPIYGGDYADNLQANNGYGICDFAIDLGAPTDNGLYTNATVYVGTGFPTNTTGTTGCGLTTSYCFSAVAIAGQLNNKSAIFVLGVDSTQSWAIYLLQSN